MGDGASRNDVRGRPRNLCESGALVSVDLLPQALALAFVGMATVFGLLAILIAAVVAMSRPRPAQSAETPEDAGAQAEMAAAVAAAIRHHRARAGAGAATGP